MNREVALKIVLAVVGVLFLALAYPLIVFVRQDPALSMMFSLYVALGVFLLVAIRNPLANRSLIAFTAWSSFAHAAVMGTQALRNMISRGELAGVAVLVVIGVALIALAPPKQPAAPAADKVLPLADNNTKIVPGHGPLGNKADLTKFRDMLGVARDRVQQRKAAGKSAGEIAASKPFADLDATWGKGFFNGDVFAQAVYSAL